jgi:multicomponent Na+:H+ antiporter subunit E
VSRFLQRLWRLPALALWATGAIASASMQVARDIIKPSAALKPGIVIVPVYLTTATQVAVWVSLINLTPGTLTVEISDDLDEAWVHSLYAGDPAELKNELRALQDRVSYAFVTPLAPSAKGGAVR